VNPEKEKSYFTICVTLLFRGVFPLEQTSKPVAPDLPNPKKQEKQNKTLLFFLVL